MASSFRRTIQRITQKGKSSRWRKPLLILLLVIVVFVGLTILFISPITKHLVEKYDHQYTGREIRIDRAYVNPFTGFINFSNIRMYENESDSIFFSAQDLSLIITLRKLFSKTYEISRFTLDQPSVKILQDKEDFNFNDLVAKFSGAADTIQTIDTTSEPIHFNILDVRVKNGILIYNESGTPIDYSIVKLNIESPGMRWDVDSITTRFSFSPGKGDGDLKGEMMVNMATDKYRIATIIDKFELEILNQYLQDLSNYGSMSALLDADIRTSGSFHSVDSVTITGSMSVNDFHFGKSPEEDYLSFDTLSVSMNEVSPLTGKFYFDSIVVKKPYFKYERYDSLDNIEAMFGKEGSNIDAAQANEGQFNLILELGDYMKQLSKHFFRSDFMIKKLAVYDANLRFEDYSLAEKFAMALNPLTVVADSIDKDKKLVNVHVTSGVEPYGNMKVVLGLNPKDTTDFDIRYDVNKIPATMFNPYLISQTSYPLDRGTIEMEGTWKVRNGKIESDNHLVVIDPRLTKKINSKLTRWIPMKLIMAFVRENGNVIDYQIPIKGDLNDPKFKLSDVVWDVVKNIFIKPVTTAYRMEVKTVETQIEKSLSMNWDMHQASLGSTEERFIKSMVKFLNDNPEAIITVTPQYYEEKEKEYILFYEAKKRYYATQKNLPQMAGNQIKVDQEDSLKIEKMSVKDSAFVEYLHRTIKDSLLFTIQEKCAQLVDRGVVEAKFKQLKKAREEVFMARFEEEGLDIRVQFAQGKNVIPFNGFSYYQIDYEGDFPESLRKAYDKMNRLNNEPPRRKFKEERT